MVDSYFFHYTCWNWFMLGVLYMDFRADHILISKMLSGEEDISREDVNMIYVHYDINNLPNMHKFFEFALPVFTALHLIFVIIRCFKTRYFVDKLNAIVVVWIIYVFIYTLMPIYIKIKDEYYSNLNMAEKLQALVTIAVAHVIIFISILITLILWRKSLNYDKQTQIKVSPNKKQE